MVASGSRRAVVLLAGITPPRPHPDWPWHILERLGFFSVALTVTPAFSGHQTQMPVEVVSQSEASGLQGGPVSPLPSIAPPWSAFL